MVVGQIGYHNSKRVKYIVVKKNHDLVKRIEKTRSEDMTPDLQAERFERDRRIIDEDKATAKVAADEDKAFKLVNMQISKLVNLYHLFISLPK